MKTSTKWIAFFTEHPTAANLLMFFFILLGLMTIGDLRRETFPDFTSTEVCVTASYPGATAEDVEMSVCERIEDAIEGISNIKEIRSEASEGLAMVTIEMVDGVDATEFLNDIKTEVDAISDFPNEVEKVVVKRLNRTDQVLSIAVTGPMSESHLKLYCEQVKNRLKQLPLVSQVKISGFSTHQLQVEVPFINLMRLKLSIADIKNTIESQSLDMPAGSLETSESNYLIRFAEERRNIRELQDLVVVSGQHGAEIRLGDIARISDRFENEEDKVLFNGKRAGFLQINKTKSQDALDIVDQVRTFLEKEQIAAPPGVKFTITQNSSDIIRDRLNMLLVNGIEGLLLVFFTMWLFFSFRMSFWVAMGLPVSFLLTFFFMKQIDFSLNMLSMVGLLIAIGILMDDAIVISENVIAHLQKGKKAFNATVDGVAEVAGGVLSSFLTTVFIFGALALSMTGDIGKVLYAIPIVLILTITISLVEAFCILPSHLSHALSHRSQISTSQFKKKFNTVIEWIKDRLVGSVVDLAITWRYLFIGLVLFVFIVSLAMIPAGHLKMLAFPETDGDVLQSRILLPQGTPLHRTQQVVDRVVAAIQKVNQELTPQQPQQQTLVKNISVLFNTNVDAGESGPHVATVSADLLSAEMRNSTIDEITSKWRENTGQVEDVISIAFKETGIGPGGLAIEIRLQGTDLDRLKQASTRLIDQLSVYQGVFDLNDDLRPGKPGFIIKLKKGAMVMGFDAQTIANQIRTAFYGTTVNEIQSGGESYDITVRIAEEDRSSVRGLTHFHVINSSGEKVPLQSVAIIRQSRGYARINRINSLRTVTITGDVDTRVANTAQIIDDLKASFLPKLEAEFPDILISTEGQSREIQTSMQGMLMAFLIGIFGVFAMLSFQFKSYLEPLVIMGTIPFALIGVIWGHLLMGLNLSMPSIMGFISLAGIVVNDAILLIGFIRNHTEKGEAVHMAARLASRERFRAVLLTSTTTIMGLLPLLSERSTQAQTMIPLACSIVFGLMASTFLILIVIPALYTIFSDLNLIRKSR